MACPYMAYRESDEEVEFDQERAFCTVIDAFVQPMRADICNDRYDLHHADHCEYYLEYEAEKSDAETPTNGTTTDESTTNETPSEQERVEEP